MTDPRTFDGPHPRFFDGIDTYAYTLLEGRGTLVWDVTRAQQLIARRSLGRQEVDREQLRHIATTYDITEAKVAAADPTQPGIAAPFIWDGDPALCPQGRVYILVDGIHRAVRALRDGVPFYAEVLTDEDNRACILAAPPGVIP